MHELADPVDDLHLVRLQPPDEVPAERIAVLGVLLFERLSAVLPHYRHTRLDERRHVGERTSFVAATTVTDGPTAACTWAKRLRILSGESTDHPLHPARAPVAAVREEQLRVVAGAQVDALDPFDPGGEEGALGSAPEVELPQLVRSSSKSTDTSRPTS